MQPGEKLAKRKARYKEYGLDLYVWISVFPFLLFNPIHTIRRLRGSGIWEKCYGTVPPGPGSRSESKRMTRYTMEYPGEKPLECTKSTLTFPSGRQEGNTFSLIPSRSWPQSPLPTGHDYTQRSNNACRLRLRSIIS